VAGALLLVAGVIYIVARRRMRHPALMEDTKRSLKEDVGWVRTRLSF